MDDPSDDSSAARAALGLESGVVRVVPYNPLWSALYAEEAARLTRRLADFGVSLTLEHSGSTAVPGLSAKPVVDMIGGRASDSDRSRIIQALEAAGYSHRGEQDIPGRDFFRRGNPRQYHLHVTLIGSAFWNDHRAFRDILRAEPPVARAYADLKRDLARQFPRNREAYTNGKSDFIRAVLACQSRPERDGERGD